MNNERINFENQCRGVFDKNITQQISRYHVAINNVAVEVNEPIPNSWITANNKWVEISSIFKNANLSVYSKNTNNQIHSNILGEALFIILLKMSNASNEKFCELESFCLLRKNEELKKAKYQENLEDNNILINLFNKLRFEFIKESFKFSDLRINKKIDSLVNEYLALDEEIFTYNLTSSNIITALNNLFSTFDYSPEEIEKVLECTYQDLTSLNLSDIIPAIKKEFSIDLFRDSLKVSEYTQNNSKLFNENGIKKEELNKEK